MPFLDLLIFCVLAGAAAYVQTLTGFAFGLILMGAVGLTGLIPLRDAAAILSILTLFNAAGMLRTGWVDVRKNALLVISLASIPMSFIGYGILDYFASTQLLTLQFILGVVIVVSSIQLLQRPKVDGSHNGTGAMFFYGGLAGIMGGMFSTSGPPIVYHLYRLPWPREAVRVTLVAVFAVNSLFRTGVVVADGTFPPPTLWPAFVATFFVIGGTYAARRFPAPLSPKSFRHLIFILLLASGLSLGIPALVKIINLSLS